MIDWLTDWLINWLTDWLIELMIVHNDKDLMKKSQKEKVSFEE